MKIRNKETFVEQKMMVRLGAAVIALAAYVVTLHFLLGNPNIKIEFRGKVQVPATQTPLRIIDQCIDSRYVCDDGFLSRFSSTVEAPSESSEVGRADVTNNVHKQICGPHWRSGCQNLFKLEYHWSDPQMIKALGSKDEVLTTLTQIFTLTNTDKDRFLNSTGYSNVFFVKDKEGVIRSVRVCRSDPDRWLIGDSLCDAGDETLFTATKKIVQEIGSLALAIKSENPKSPSVKRIFYGLLLEKASAESVVYDLGFEGRVDLDEGEVAMILHDQLSGKSTVLTTQSDNLLGKANWHWIGAQWIAEVLNPKELHPRFSRVFYEKTH